MLFFRFCEFLEGLEATSSRLEMADILSQLYKDLSDQEARIAAYLVLGQIEAPFRGLETGLSDKLIIEGISKACNIKQENIAKLYKDLGDLGLVAERSIKWSGRSLELLRVYGEILQIAKDRAMLNKLMGFINLLKGLSPIEARYAVRIVLGKLRLGVGESTLIDALALSVSERELKPQIERAYTLCSDLGKVAMELKRGGKEALEGFKLEVGYPVRMALAERVKDAQELFQRLGPCALEAKYDGLRLQVHKANQEVTIFSRSLENITHMFPEVVEETKNLEINNIIFEGEAVILDEESGEFFPFQAIVRRKRKHQVEKYAKEMPVNVFVFDILYLNSQDLTNLPLIERREHIEKLFKRGRLRPSELTFIKTPEEIEDFFESVLLRGLEGIMAKRLDGIYSAGARNFNWVKLKRSYRGQLKDSIDVVILGYYSGKGSRVKLGIGGLLVGIYDEINDEFLTVSKIGSGFTQEEWQSLKSKLDEIKLNQKPKNVKSILEPDFWVEPKYVISVEADEITLSKLHTAGMDKSQRGLALRFPRALGYIREDKTPKDTTSPEELRRLYELQPKVSVE
ncbi:MAG: ATP-dependent DNA ligase [Aquificaceae bacterium]